MHEPEPWNPDPHSDRAKYISLQSFEKKRWRAIYKRGWDYSDNTDIPDHKGLDGNPYGGWQYDAWEAGYMDRAGERPYGHRRDCPLSDHNECPGY